MLYSLWDIDIHAPIVLYHHGPWWLPWNMQHCGSFISKQTSSWSMLIKIAFFAFVTHLLCAAWLSAAEPPLPLLSLDYAMVHNSFVYLYCVYLPTIIKTLLSLHYLLCANDWSDVCPVYRQVCHNTTFMGVSLSLHSRLSKRWPTSI